MASVLLDNLYNLSSENFFVIFYTLDLSETQNYHENKKQAGAVLGSISQKVWFDCGWIMWLASKHVLTEKTNFAFKV